MKKKLQVFVSSTYTDMTLERQAAVEAILLAGHIPAGMELFAAGSESQWEVISRWIDDSDVFMLILGGRYGSIEKKSGKSYIELEYRYATEKNKPLFAVVITEDYLQVKGVDSVERKNGNLLEEFREMVTQKICRFFGDISGLKLAVMESLNNFGRDENLAGWIHGSDVVDPRTAMEEIGRLKQENNLLRDKIEILEANAITMSKAEQQKPSEANLSQDARQVLVAASNGNGSILFMRHLNGFVVRAGQQNLMRDQSAREMAHWKATLEELRELRLIEAVDSDGDAFRLTKRGFETADRIKSSSE